MSSPHPAVLAPSILAGNHARLAESMGVIVQSGAPWLHLDIMDGHFVPNLTFGPQTLKALRAEASPSLFFDVHLMLENPNEHAQAFIDAGADLVSIHIEPEALDVGKTLEAIRDQKCQTGIVLNPATPLKSIEPFLSEVDLILVMTVQPGFGGQPFQTHCLEKIEQLHRWRDERSLPYRIEVDGGINLETGLQCRNQGADTFVTGTAFFQAKDKPSFRRSLTA